MLVFLKILRMYLMNDPYWLKVISQGSEYASAKSSVFRIEEANGGVL